MPSGIHLIRMTFVACVTVAPDIFQWQVEEESIPSLHYNTRRVVCLPDEVYWDQHASNFAMNRDKTSHSLLWPSCHLLKQSETKSEQKFKAFERIWKPQESQSEEKKQSGKTDIAGRQETYQTDHTFHSGKSRPQVFNSGLVTFTSSESEIQGQCAYNKHLRTHRVKLLEGTYSLALTWNYWTYTQAFWVGPKLNLCMNGRLIHKRIVVRGCSEVLLYSSQLLATIEVLWPRMHEWMKARKRRSRAEYGWNQCTDKGHGLFLGYLFSPVACTVHKFYNQQLTRTSQSTIRDTCGPHRTAKLQKWFCWGLPNRESFRPKKCRRNSPLREQEKFTPIYLP